MKQDPICVGCKDSGLDLSGNDLAETMLKSCRTCGLSPNICLWYCEVGEIQRPNLFRSTYIPGEWVLNMNIQLTSNEPCEQEAADYRLKSLEILGQRGRLTFRVLPLTERLHQLRQVVPDREHAADDQVDRNKPLHWAVVQVHRSCIAHLETSSVMFVSK